MKDKALTQEQMRELKELGIDTSKASMCYCDLESDEYNFGKNVIVPNNDTFYGLYRENAIPTFTLHDILEMLPDSIVDKEGYNRILLIVPQENKEVIMDYDHTVQFYGKWLDTAFNMLKWIKQNNFI